MKYIFLFIFTFFLVIPIAADAGILPPCTATGNCGVCDMLFTVNAIMRWIVYIAGSAALVLFVWAGVMFLTSAGRSDKVSQAKSIMVGTITGVVIIFIAWTFVNFLIGEIAGSQKVLFGRTEAWYNVCVSRNNQQCLGKGDGYPCSSDPKKNLRDMHCEDGKCVSGEACEWLNDHKGYEDYKCQPPDYCGLENYSECDTAPNCIKNLCADGIDRVCCFPKNK